MRRRVRENPRLRYPKDVLARKWRSLPKDQLRAYLVRILTIELHSYPQSSAKSGRRPRNKRMQFRLRRRRHQVIKRFLSLGGKVSSRIAGHGFPHGREWPGVVSVVESRGFDLLP